MSDESTAPWRDEEKLRRLYAENNLSTREIAQRWDCSRKTVGNWIRRYEIEKPWKDKQRLSELRKQGLSQREIAEELETNQGTISEWMNHFDLDTSQITDEEPWHDAKTLRELYVEDQLTIQEIANKFDCNWSTVWEWMREHGIERRTPNPETPDELRDGETLRRLYREEGKSTYQIADDLGCAPSTVYDWLHRHGIETRSVGSQPGELHHRWKGGRQPYYGANWHEQRRKALERDNHTCQRCGIDGQEHRTTFNCQLHVHHLEPLRQFENPKEANTLENLTTLCFECHNKVEGNRSSG